MKGWEWAESKVKTLTGGRPTPGSGSKGVRGDVVTQHYRFEVKYTQNPKSINLQYSWFKTLEHLWHTTDLESVLVVFFNEVGIVFLIECNNPSPSKKWSSMKLNLEDLPEDIKTERYTWKIYDLYKLTEL